MQEGTQARHADLLAHAVLRALDARARARHQAEAGDGLRGEAAAGDQHQVQSAVDRLQEHRGRRPADLQRIGLQRRRDGGVQRDELELDVQAALLEIAFLGCDEDRGEVGHGGVAEDDLRAGLGAYGQRGSGGGGGERRQQGASFHHGFCLLEVGFLLRGLGPRQRGAQPADDEVHQHRRHGRIAAPVLPAREPLDAVVVQVMQQRAERELVGPCGLAARGMRQRDMQRVDVGLGQRVEVAAQHAVGLFGRVIELARHQQRVVLALGARAQRQHRAGEGFDDARQRLRIVGVVAHRAQAGQPLLDGVAPVLEDGVKQLVLGAVVVAHQRQRHAGLVGDLANRHRVVAVLREQLLGREKDRLPAIGPDWGSALHTLNHGRIEQAYKLVEHSYKPCAFPH